MPLKYDSVIRQHGFERLELPDSLNLGNPDMETNYSSVTVKLDFKRFKTVDPVFKGELIRYGLTIPNNAPHPEADRNVLLSSFTVLRARK